MTLFLFRIILEAISLKLYLSFVMTISSCHPPLKIIELLRWMPRLHKSKQVIFCYLLFLFVTWMHKNIAGKGQKVELFSSRSHWLVLKLLIGTHWVHITLQPWRLSLAQYNNLCVSIHNLQVDQTSLKSSCHFLNKYGNWSFTN